MTAESDETGGVEATGPRLGSRAPAFVQRSRRRFKAGGADGADEGAAKAQAGD
jgi:hypothetical protein